MLSPSCSVGEGSAQSTCRQSPKGCRDQRPGAELGPFLGSQRRRTINVARALVGEVFNYRPLWVRFPHTHSSVGQMAGNGTVFWTKPLSASGMSWQDHPITFRRGDDRGSPSLAFQQTDTGELGVPVVAPARKHPTPYRGAAPSLAPVGSTHKGSNEQRIKGHEQC